MRALRLHLVLGRVSNLPTVWSNVLAGVLLAGGGWSAALPGALAAGSLVYTGGMYLNDALDAAFDEKFRPERPIPSGQISRRAVAAIGLALLAAGGGIFIALAPAHPWWPIGLVACVALYDVWHKGNPLAPLLMGGCRALLVLAAAVAAGGDPARAGVAAGSLGIYVAGISLVASGSARWLGWLAVLSPLAIELAWTRTLPLLALPWLAWLALLAGRRTGGDALVCALLAGIALVDLMNAGTIIPGAAWVFPALFVATLAAQRRVPAT